MAIIVDKEQKKRDIALSCKELILSKGISNITVAEVAKSAGVGKGTIYEYFANKDEIVFELVNILMQKHAQKLKEALETKTTTKEKIREFSRFFYAPQEADLRKLYKEFISLSLVAPNNEMMAFHTQCTESYFSWFEAILQDGIAKKELKEEALQLAKGIFVVGNGMFIQNSVICKEESIQKDLDSFIDTIFDLMERK